MKEYPDFGGRDIRAVESPYEAVFELARIAGAFSRRTVTWLWVLIFFCGFYMALTMAIVYLNLFVFNLSDLRFLGLTMAGLNIAAGALSLRWLFSSKRSFGLIGQNLGLLRKLGTSARTEPAAAGPPGRPSGARPKDALDGLIECTIEDSRRLMSAYRYVYVFIALWMLNSVVFFAVQSYRFGPNFMEWRIDWMVPGGTGLDAYLFLALSVYAYLRTRAHFDFLRTRHRAIGYALVRPRARVPAGETPLDRYKAALAEQDGPGAGPAWSSTAFFSAVRTSGPGTVLVKALDTTPDAEALAEFVRHARAQGENVRHAVLLYPEDPEKPLPEEVYNEVVNNPIRVGKELFTVELVMEGRDGFYDFIPVVPP